MSSKTITTKFFIEPLNDLTNEILAGELSREGLTIESETIIYFEGKPKRVYQIEYRFVTMLQKSVKHQRNICVYRQRGNGKIELWKFGIRLCDLGNVECRILLH